MKNTKSKVLSALVLLFSIFRFPFSVHSQVRPVYDYGAIGLGQLLKKLNTTKSVMHIGAHPDDEDSGLLAYLARGESARTAYLSLTRGDGGQNIIGSELFESLGVIRTEELLQARRLDGAEQYFTRAFDFGFSKTLEETKGKWDEKIILCDAVRAIRTFRPLVVISRFSGTPADGHGQHQYAGYIAPLAVKAAADANQCRDSGAAWQVLKFYVSQGFRSTTEPKLKINVGQYDYLLGRSYFEIAMEGRSQHKTQEQGVLELKGERLSGLNLIESKVPKVENETSVFDGIDTSIIGLAEITRIYELSFESRLNT
ncbi:MAG: PIG-L family deacetylase, partial [Pyrinomonadaceae bacterium]|nr:PIG-L family deacetylase [Pyrinomonadaceae bacterium]